MRLPDISARFALLLCVIVLAKAAQTTAPGSPSALPPPPLDQEVAFYEIKDGSLIDGLAELSRSPGVRLHLGIEAVLRERLASPQDRSAHFSLRLDHKKVRDILNALCASDPRYVWSIDGSTINVSPQRRVTDATDLLNFRIEEIQFHDIRDPDHALSALHRLFPKEPIGYMQVGGDNAYDGLWTASFRQCTVRQFINRITEHVGPQTSWIWQGGKDNRMFTFLSGGFNSR